MRAKFGTSNGLKSGGKMAGIGSDPNYQHGSGGSGGGGTDINELGATAFSFVSSWVDTVSKVQFLLASICAHLCFIINPFTYTFLPLFLQTTQQLIQENSSKNNSNSSNNNGSSSNQQAADPWAAITTGEYRNFGVAIFLYKS